MVLIPLCYLLTCSYIGLFSMKVSGIYALHNHKQTDPSSLLFSCYYLMRFAVPLVYNFMGMTAVNKSAFFDVMGPIKRVEFMGTYFNRWVFPIALFLMAFLTLFNIYGKVLNCLGLNRYKFGGSSTHEHIEDGKAIVEEFKRDNSI